jgi:hypothetical protein
MVASKLGNLPSVELSRAPFSLELTTKNETRTTSSFKNKTTLYRFPI